MGQDEKLTIIQKTFKIEPLQPKIIDVLMVRSSAGQEKIWNAGITVINYNFLAGMLGKKFASGNISFSEFENESNSYMDELIRIAAVSTTVETLSIGELRIRFPDQHFNDQELIKYNLKMGNQLGNSKA